MPFAERATLFSVGEIRAFEMGEADIPVLQAFFEQNPAYYIVVSGEGPKPDEAKQEVLGPLPEGWLYTKKWIIGFADGDGGLCGMANVVSDLLAVHVWHIGFFLIETSRYGAGTGRALYQGLEDWMRREGARWLRLGVVEGNERAERFWKRRGYVEVRKRPDMPFGARMNTVSVQVKALTGGTIEDYFSIVARDRPD